MVNRLAERPNESVPQAAQTDSESQSIYRFWSNPQVQASQILASHRLGVVSRARSCAVVLAIQDTTDFDFTSHPATRGLGFINQTRQQGIKVHSCLAVSGAGEPLGILHQHSWVRQERNGKKEQRRRKAIGEKESHRWLTTLKAAEVGLAKATTIVHIGDREADIFELFAQSRAPGSELLIRAEHNRRVRHELGSLIPTVEAAPLLGHTTIEVHRTPDRAARTAHLSIKGMQVTLEVPQNHPKPHTLEPVTLNVLLVQEVGMPDDSGAPIRWLLLTTLPIENFEQAWQCVVWYSYRWLIERFHFTLKSGCRLEALQLQDKDRLLKALACYNIVAWRLMHLIYHARRQPDAPCTSILEPQEWRLLRRRFEPMNRSKRPPTMRQAIRWIAQLGGFLARKGDGEPGLKTLWRGLNTFHKLLQGAQLAAQT